MADPEPLQFGVAEPGVAYRDRPASFGVALRDGRSNQTPWPSTVTLTMAILPSLRATPKDAGRSR